jgi:hypothetical protein
MKRKNNRKEKISKKLEIKNFSLISFFLNSIKRENNGMETIITFLAIYIIVGFIINVLAGEKLIP